MKTFARQVPPEYQESPLMLDGIWPDGMIVCGNDRMTEHTTPEFDLLLRSFGEMAGVWESANFVFHYDHEAFRFDKIKKPKPELDGEPYSLRELLRDYGFSRPDGKPWTTKQRHAWRELLESDAYAEDDSIILPALELMTGHEWESATIRGCCQGDWQDVLYRTDLWSRESLDCFEAEYFNTGTEWMIHDEDTEPESAEDITGYSMYCYGWSPDTIRREIANVAGCSPEDVVLYEYVGSYSVPKYEIA